VVIRLLVQCLSHKTLRRCRYRRLSGHISMIKSVLWRWKCKFRDYQLKNACWELLDPASTKRKPFWESFRNLMEITMFLIHPFILRWKVLSPFVFSCPLQSSTGIIRRNSGSKKSVMPEKTLPFIGISSMGLPLKYRIWIIPIILADLKALNGYNIIYR